MQAFHIE